MIRIPKLRRNGDGRMFAVYPKSNGKREYFGTEGDPETERKYRQWLARVLNGATVPKGRDLLIVDVVEAFLEHAEREWGRDSREFSHIWKALDRLLEIAADMPADEIGPQMLSIYEEKMLGETYQRTKNSEVRQYSYRTIQIAVDWVKRMVKWACAKEMIQPIKYHELEPFELSRETRRRKRKVPHVAWEVVNATLPYMNSTIASLVKVQWFCGMRPSEARTMTPQHILKEGEVWLYRPESHKTAHRGHSLVKAIPRSAQAILASLEPSEPQWPYFDAGRECRKDKSPRPYNQFAYTNAVKKACQRAGVSVWTPNQLRHGIATAIEERFGREAAQKYLGHANMDTTAIYAERTVRELVTLASRLEDEVFSGYF